MTGRNWYRSRPVRRGALRALAVWLVALTVVVTGLPAGGPFDLPSGVSQARAQERQPGLLELLFRRNRGDREPAAKQQRPRQAAPRQAAPRRTAPSQPRSSVASAPVAPREPAVEKAENAVKVLVVGDFVADGLARGLVDAFADSPNVVVERRINGSSGFVRDDFYDWPGEIGAIVEEVEPQILVVHVGANDRQAMRVDGSSAAVLSDPWRAEYQRRIDAFIGEAGEAGVALVWTGTPPFRFRSMSADMLALNEIFRERTEAAGGFFVDIWDGFVDAEGNFIERGPDIKGQVVRLRGSDGINFTPAGQRKLAFYVERQLQQILGDSALPLVTSLGPDSLPIMKLPPLQTEAELERVNPIGFADPDLDGGSVLLGDVTAPEAAENPLQARSVRQRLVEEGLPPPAQPGRAGSFAPPPPGDPRTADARTPEERELGATLQ
ncbi:MAG: DUF459 domain-containing protein [Roseitalea porphyridii]|jgi:hypothetical protein|uniref:SGNH/GDSL hydrolase family protein n=1 Tax=Roseitalea porphyridii TaxID=1852022 RepID=UPI0032EE7CE5